MLALARKLAYGDENDAADTVEAVFAQARAAETESKSYLVHDGWQAPHPVTLVMVEMQQAEENVTVLA